VGEIKIGAVVAVVAEEIVALADFGSLAFVAVAGIVFGVGTAVCKGCCTGICCCCSGCWIND